MAASDESSGNLAAASVNEQAIIAKWNNLRTEINRLYSKITELELERSEHDLVIAAIQHLEPARKCYRMIGGVLVERTVAEVTPAVKRNREGLEEIIVRFTETLNNKRNELADLEKQYNIKIRRADELPAEEKKVAAAPSQGVLVGPAGS